MTTATDNPAENDIATECLCPKCEAPGLGDSVDWCLQCGWYPRMGFYVEVDPQQQAYAAEMSPWDPRRVPVWAWILSAGLIAITAGSIAVRMMFPEGTITRALWAIGQTIIGLGVFFVFHLMAYLRAIGDDSTMTLMDFMMRPLKTWGPTIHDLPATGLRVCFGAWALVATVFGPTLIGGIPYHLIWEYGPKEQAGPNLVQAITAAARGVEGEEKPLGDAIQDFAGPNAADEQQDFDKFAPENLPQRKRKLDCVILGYKPSGDDGFSALVLGAALNNKLQVVGTVSNEFIPPPLRAEMFEKFQQIRRKSPFVPSTIDAVWVEPRMTCRVGYNGVGASNRITETVFQAALGDVDAK